MPSNPSVASSPRGLRALTSAIVERLGFAAKFGLTFNGKRRVHEACGYQDELTPDDYEWRYERNEIAGAVIDSMPQATWRNGGALMEDENVENDTTFELEFKALNERLNIWPTCEKADKLAGLGEFSVILIGAAGELDQPLERVAGSAGIVYLKAFGQKQAKIESYEQDSKNARFGQPTIYKITVPTTGTGTTDKRVHYTRIVHVADDTLKDEVTGRPKLQRVWNRIDDLEKVVGGGAEAFFQRVHGLKQLDIDPTVELDEDDERKLSDEVDEAIHGLRRYIRTRGMKINDLGSQVSGFDKNVDSLLHLIAAGARIPYRILTGSEMGELASSQDKNNWNERVNDRRLSFAGPKVVRPLVDRLIALGALPQPKQYTVVWPDVQDRTTEESAALAKTMAETNQAQGETVTTSDEIRDIAYGLPPLAEVDPEAAARRDDPDEDLDVDRDEDDDEEFDARAAARTPAPWRAIHKAADANRDRVRAAFASAFRDAREHLSLTELESDLREGREHEVSRQLREAVLSMEEALTDAVPARLLDALVAGGRAAERSFSAATEGGTRQAADLGMAFDAKHPEAERWARQHGAALIRQVSEDTRDAVRLIVARAFREGIPARQAARLIKSLIGLTSDDANAVVNARFKLLEATAGSTVKVGAARVRIPVGGLSVADVQRIASQYADRLLRARALTIARTETIAASNEGQRQLWLQAVEKGLLTGRERREWLTTPDERACQICRPMDGQMRSLNEPFSTPDGVELMGPPAHPRCRCATGISRQSAETRGAAHVAA